MIIRVARREDLEAIVALLADDPLGASREAPGTPLNSGYIQAFMESENQWGNTIYVGTDDADRVIACLQLYILPGLTRTGTKRGQIEGVRIATSQRNTGLGQDLIRFAIAEAKRAGCGLVQLTTDLTREEARRFYERLGFERTHWGLKYRVN